jgi:hypothetical protein
VNYAHFDQYQQAWWVRGRRAEQPQQVRADETLNIHIHIRIRNVMTSTFELNYRGFLNLDRACGGLVTIAHGMPMKAITTTVLLLAATVSAHPYIRRLLPVLSVEGAEVSLCSFIQLHSQSLTHLLTDPPRHRHSHSFLPLVPLANPRPTQDPTPIPRHVLHPVRLTHVPIASLTHSPWCNSRTPTYRHPDRT